jgi:hypothetical protein
VLLLDVPLGAHPSVADSDDAVGDRGHGGIVGDDHGGASLFPRELGDEPVDQPGVLAVELARGLVGEEEAGAVGDRGAHGHALLLAARELGGARAGALAQPDALEHRVRPPRPLGARDADQAELERHELAGGELRIERAPVVLLDVPERAGPVLGAAAPRKRGEVRAEDAHRPRGGAVERGQEAKQGRFPRSARPEDRGDLARLDRERESLERRRASLGRLVDAKDVPGLDALAHRASSSAYGARNARAL